MMSNCKIQGNSIRHPMLRVSTHAGPHGGGIQISEQQRSLPPWRGWRWTAGVASTRGHPPESRERADNQQLTLGCRVRGWQGRNPLASVAMLQTAFHAEGLCEVIAEAAKLQKDPLWPVAGAGCTTCPHAHVETHVAQKWRNTCLLLQ